MKESCARIEWIDSVGNGGWHGCKEEDNEPVTCLSIGVVHSESKKAITIWQSRSSLGSLDNSITIPKCSIKSIKRFKV